MQEGRRTVDLDLRVCHCNAFHIEKVDGGRFRLFVWEKTLE
jgi:hypothetical protein